VRIYLDTADAGVARELFSWGCFSGATTNPILLARAGVSVERAIEGLAAALSGEIFAQTRGATGSELCDEGYRLASLAPGRIVVKVPMSEAGLAAIALLKARHVPTAATALYRASQALLAARAGATYAIPFWHRIGAAGGDPAAEVGEAARWLERLTASGIRARVLCASLRTAAEATAALAAGAHALTVSPEVARALADHPGTRAAVEEFARATAPDE
jgi:fructose-6-phosphate aldolase 1